MKLIFKAILVMLTLSSNFLWSESTACTHCMNQRNDDIIPCKKRYIELDKIVFVDKAIFVSIEEEVFSTPAIFSDEGGYFIQSVKGDNRCNFTQWECGHCGYCNWVMENCCLVCERNRNGKKCN